MLELMLTALKVACFVAEATLLAALALGVMGLLAWRKK